MVKETSTEAAWGPRLLASKVFEMDMGRSRQIKRAILLIACVGLLALSVGGANAALIKVGNLVLKADGGFVPTALPRDRYEPIDFHGHANLINTEGGAPTALEEMRLDFDRDGMLETRGLPVCPVGRIAHATVGEARRQVRRRDHRHRPRRRDLRPLRRARSRPGSRRPSSTARRKGGNPTVVGHTYTTLPTTRTYTVVIPIKPLKHGPYSYRATFDVPKLAADGVLTHIDGRIGRRYQFKGTRTQLRQRPLHDRGDPHPRPLPLRRRHDHGRHPGKALHAPCPCVPAALATFLYFPAPGR